MSSLSPHRLIRALLRQPVDRTPVWLMRQAGRYLPEYRALRDREPNFMAFCKQPELACQATLQPLARFPLDAAIIFSDILTIADAMGMPLEIAPSVGPIIHNPIQSFADVEKLQQPEVEDVLGYVFEAIRLVSKELAGRVPLIGFAGSPWTLACYMIEGQGSKTFHRTKAMLYGRAEIVSELLHRLSNMTLAYLNAQIAAGADAVMLFDTWGGILPTDLYRQFSLRYLSHIVASLNRDRNGQTIPVIFFTKGGGQWLEMMVGSGCDAIGLDWTTPLDQARQRVGDQLALQGNLDPAVLFTDPKTVATSTKKILQAYGGGTGHVFNLGHGIYPNTPIDNVTAMIDTVTRFRHATARV